MGFSLSDLLKVTVLLINAVCILNEKRFLNKFGLGTQGGGDMFADQGSRAQAIRTIASIRLVTTFPLMFINSLVIIMAVVFG